MPMLIMAFVTGSKFGRRYISVNKFWSPVQTWRVKFYLSPCADTKLSLFGINMIRKKSVLKLLKSSSTELACLSQLSYSDIYTYTCVAKHCKVCSLVRLTPNESSFKQYGFFQHANIDDFTSSKAVNFMKTVRP